MEIDDIAKENKKQFRNGFVAGAIFAAIIIILIVVVLL